MNLNEGTTNYQIHCGYQQKIWVQLKNIKTKLKECHFCAGYSLHNNNCSNKWLVNQKGPHTFKLVNDKHSEIWTLLVHSIPKALTFSFSSQLGRITCNELHINKCLKFGNWHFPFSCIPHAICIYKTFFRLALHSVGFCGNSQCLILLYIIHRLMSYRLFGLLNAAP